MCDQRNGDTDGDGWPDTLPVIIASGGHLLSRRCLPILGAPGDRSPPRPSIDIRRRGRRSGGYLVGSEPSIAGRPCTFHNDADIRDLPAWLGTLLLGGQRCR
ncbi:hypothetical protein [Micromonospora sp. KC721]|uniref:hypothetical protein n=1 Tax=Micromonospora sp. KC721 TaxID=2530380 RepID=UPI00104DFC75|nr:hypothetical protein [Micromonospora sp. KC721]TDB80217.1 hypothetical protein E1182_09780 [Micromonospora sp. KC721]